MSYLVIGMHLDAEVLTGIDKLNQQGELVAEALIVLLSYQLFTILAHQLVQALALVGTVGHDGLVILHTRDFPALAYIL